MSYLLDELFDLFSDEIEEADELNLAESEEEFFDSAFYGSEEAAIEREIDEMEAKYGL